MDDAVKLAERFTASPLFQNLSPPVQTALFLGALVLIPTALVVLTPFTRIVIVLTFARQAVTTQQIPPNPVIIGLSLFLTLFVMGPSLDEMNERAITPYLDGRMSGAQAFGVSTGVLHKFMLRQTRKQDLALFIHLAKVPTPAEPAETPFRVVVPAFVISELKTAFIMGFLLFMPFLLVDLVVSSILTAMGMVQLPPVIISAPFKILLFVLADGWHLVARALSLSFG
jgi:flagellar biosynthetic protein FliP